MCLLGVAVSMIYRKLHLLTNEVHVIYETACCTNAYAAWNQIHWIYWNFDVLKAVSSLSRYPTFATLYLLVIFRWQEIWPFPHENHISFLHGMLFFPNDISNLIDCAPSQMMYHCLLICILNDCISYLSDSENVQCVPNMLLFRCFIFSIRTIRNSL